MFNISSFIQGRHTGSAESKLNFGSGDYLGLASDPAVILGASDAISTYGLGLAMNQPFATIDIQEQLKVDTSIFLGTEAALLFGSCTAANIALITTLAAAKNTLVIDTGCHPSSSDGCALAKGRIAKYESRSLDSLRSTLKSVPGSPVDAVMTDGVFSVDGTVARLRDIVAIRGDGPYLIVDDSHGVGVLGTRGRGTPEHAGLTPRADNLLLTGTFAKALGCGSGGYIAGPSDVLDEVQRVANFYKYNTGMNIASIGAARVALKIAGDDHERRARLFENTRHVRARLRDAGFEIEGTESAISSIKIGDDSQAREVGRRLADLGVLVTVVAAPVIPAGNASLRLQMSSRYGASDVDRFCDALCGQMEDVLQAHDKNSDKASPASLTPALEQ